MHLFCSLRSLEFYSLTASAYVLFFSCIVIRLAAKIPLPFLSPFVPFSFPDFSSSKIFVMTLLSSLFPTVWIKWIKWVNHDLSSILRYQSGCVPICSSRCRYKYIYITWQLWLALESNTIVKMCNAQHEDKYCCNSSSKYCCKYFSQLQCNWVCVSLSRENSVSITIWASFNTSP